MEKQKHDVITLSSSDKETKKDRIEMPRNKRIKIEDRDSLEIVSIPGFVLERLWNKMSTNMNKYMGFGEFDSEDEFKAKVTRYIEERAYGQDTADMMIYALSNAYKC